MIQLFLYGSGNRCRTLLRLINNTHIKIMGIIDSNPEKWGTYIKDYKILPPAGLVLNTDEYVCVTFFGENDYEQIWDDLVDVYGIAKEKILSYHDVLQIIFENFSIGKVENDVKNKKWNHIFAFAWKFNLGGVETWAKDTISVLSCVDKNLRVLSAKAQFIYDRNNKYQIIDHCIEKPCEFLENDVRKFIEIIINQLPCTIVCSRDDEVTLAASLIKKFYPDLIRILMVVHGACDGMVRDMYSYNKVVDYYFCVSEAVNKNLKKLCVDKNKCSVIPTLVNYHNNERKEYTTDRNKPLKIGYAGRLEVFHKRADLLLELIKDLEELEVNYLFEIAGDGDYKLNIIRFIEDNKLDEKVRYLGMLDHDGIMRFWEKKDISINISDSEGRPVSNLEAMYCGAVPIVTATCGIMDDVSDGITGYLVKIGDHMAMAEKIAEVDQNRNLLIEVGSCCQRTIKEKTNMNKYINEWMKIFHEVETNE